MAQLDERFLDVDAHGSLRVPGVLWLGMAFLARYFILALGLVFSHSQELLDALFTNKFVWMVLVLEIPAVALLMAGANRGPEGAAAWRMLWLRGRVIIAALAALHVLYASWMLWTSDVWRPWPELLLASCALLDIAIAYGVHTDGFFKQLFSEFPAPTVK